MDQNHFEFFEDDEDSDNQALDLLTLQHRLLTNLLTLTKPSSEEDDESDINVGDGQTLPKAQLTFKVLIMDQTAQQILAPVMKVGSLRDANVTLYLNLQSKREPVPDMPAVYLLCKNL